MLTMVAVTSGIALYGRHSEIIKEGKHHERKKNCNEGGSPSIRK